MRAKKRKSYERWTEGLGAGIYFGHRWTRELTKLRERHKSILPAFLQKNYRLNLSLKQSLHHKLTSSALISTRTQDGSIFYLICAPCLVTHVPCRPYLRTIVEEAVEVFDNASLLYPQQSEFFDNPSIHFQSQTTSPRSDHRTEFAPDPAAAL
jgi:hypothetical protein